MSAIIRMADWLMDRKRIPADWRKKVASLRARIAAAFASLPLLQDPWLQTYNAESECCGFLLVLGDCVVPGLVEVGFAVAMMWSSCVGTLQFSEQRSEN